MNVINKLTIRHLKENKRRTLVTIIGTIISVAMITAVATLAVSFLDLLQRQTIADEGEWHVQYFNIDEAQAAAIEDDEETKEFILSGDRGYAHFEESENFYKPYIYVRSLNQSGFENVPITLTEGRLPESPEEIVLSEEIVSSGRADYEIGDELSLEVGERVFLNEAAQEEPVTQQYSINVVDEQLMEEIQDPQEETYTVVGLIERPMWEPAWAPGYTAITYTDETMLSEDSPASGLVILEDVDRSLYANSQELAEAVGHDPENIRYNSELLRFYGVSSNDNLTFTMYSLAAIIMAVIIFGSVALIYNAFAISVSERARHLGMLASVGATKKQKRNSVFFEGALIGLMSIPAGVLSGIGGIAVTFWFVNRLMHDALNVSVPLTVALTPMSILTAVLISAFTIFISTYLPARKASRISAIEAIRQTTDIKLTEKAVRTSSIVRRIFGTEAEIGLKNLKRNKRKYQITVFSLVVSIVLFLSVSFFTESLERSLAISSESLDYDIQLMPNNGELEEEMVQSAASLPEVTNSSVVQEAYYTAWIDEEEIPAPLQEEVEEYPELLEEGKFPYYVNLYSIGDENLADYAAANGMEEADLFNSAEFPAVVIDTTVYEEGTPRRLVEAATIHTSPGEQLGLFYEDFESGKTEPVSAVTIAALTDKLPTGVSSGTGMGSLTMIVSEEVYENLLARGEGIQSNSYMYLDSTDPVKTQEDLEAMDTTMHIQNVYQNRQQNEQIMLLMSVFIYGFITLITLISVANIFNTISTSIALRKREFAMLKSVGMTSKSFNKMINYESMFYGIKSLLYGIPISIGIMYLLHLSVTNTFEYGFALPWMSLLYVVIAVFVIVGSAMLYSISKIKKDNIIETLKQENI
ncbi:ABC transporter permease [Alkalicoccus daliensis]|uniref:Putative ABC transport system permease protein n=1 Tax=Alkalicoccus daliensis TaxID=745820 RepID=A0A1H0FSX5_9BACI|nr:ABC transporter permease [Alkalicoccus daliensis]SDN97662.1 putative ABC transport system permease protein [Alkalicoccus daliensis]